MLKLIFILLMVFHGLIHFMGFAKAFSYGNMKQLSIPISKAFGQLWLLTAFLFLITALLFFRNKEWWWWLALPTILLSQFVIIKSWGDAKFGTVANLIILIVATLSFTSFLFEQSFKKDVQQNLQRSNAIKTELLTQTDLLPLPFPVQRYLIYCGVLNKPKLKNMRVVFEGEMRSKEQDWFPFRSVQYNFFDEPTRLFYMKGKMFGIPVPGYHHYRNGKAVMDIRLFGLKKMAYAAGAEMNKAETVTLFNDMCLLAPASLIDKRIQWELLDSNRVRAIFYNGAIHIEATLYFNEKGALIDFISNDRYEVNKKLWIPFSTPVSDYKSFNGIQVQSYGEAIWHYTEGAFVYGKFNLKQIEYNVSEYK